MLSENNNFVVTPDHDIIDPNDKKFFIELLETKEKIFSFENRTTLILKLVELISSSNIVSFPSDGAKRKINARRPIFVLKYAFTETIKTETEVKKHIQESIIVPFNEYVFALLDGESIAKHIDTLIDKYPSLESKMKNYIVSSKFSVICNSSASTAILELLI